MKIKNSVLIFSLFVSFLLLAPSLSPVKAQAPSCQCGINQTATGARDQETCVAGGCIATSPGTWEPNLPADQRCTCAPGKIMRDGINTALACQSNGCEQIVSGTWGVAAATPQQNAGDQAPAVQQLPNPLGADTTIPELIARVIKAAVGLVGSIGLLMFIYGGFIWMTAGGNDQKVGQGKQILTWAVLGLVLIFSSYAILGFVIDKLTNSAPQEQQGQGG